MKNVLITALLVATLTALTTGIAAAQTELPVGGVDEPPASELPPSQGLPDPPPVGGGDTPPDIQDGSEDEPDTPTENARPDRVGRDASPTPPPDRQDIDGEIRFEPLFVLDYDYDVFAYLNQTYCVVVDVTSLGEEEIETLSTLGAYPIAGGGREALYSPGCLTPGSGV